MLSEKRNNIEQYHLEENHPEKLQFELYSLDEYLKDSDGCAAKPHMHSFTRLYGLQKAMESILSILKNMISTRTLFPLYRRGRFITLIIVFAMGIFFISVSHSLPMRTRSVCF